VEAPEVVQGRPQFKTDEFWGSIDKQAMDRYGSESTAAAGIQEAGFRIFQADKLPAERKVGINGIKERLLLDDADQPQLIIFEDRCPTWCARSRPSTARPRRTPRTTPTAAAVARHRCPALSDHEVAGADREARGQDRHRGARWNRILRKAKADTDDEERISTGYGD